METKKFEKCAKHRWTRTDAECIDCVKEREEIDCMTQRPASATDSMGVVKCNHCGKPVLVQVNWHDVYKFLEAWRQEEITSARLGEILEMWANNRRLSHLTV